MKVLLFVLGVVIVNSLSSVSKSNRRTVYLHSHHIDTTEHPQWNEESYLHYADVNERLQDSTLHTFIIHVEQSHASSHSALLRTIQGDHNTRIEYIPHNSYLIHCSHDSLSKIGGIGGVQAMEGVLWIGNYHPEYKVSPSLLDRHHSRPAELVVSLSHPILSSQWNQLSNECSIERSRDDRYIVTVFDKENVQNVAEFLAKLPEVRFIQRSNFKHAKNAYSRSIVLDGSYLPSSTDFSDFSEVFGYSLGLDGTGQIVGVADTGLDYRSCYFADSLGDNVPEPPFKTWTDNATSEDIICEADLDARKIVQYVTFSDAADDNPSLDGHGTHVSGSVAGYPIDSSNADFTSYSGMATGAKLAFFDIGDATTEYLSTPTDLANQLFNWAYEAGARIHTNSWGTSDNTYTSESKDIDEFIYNNQDMVILVAAGNDGDCHTSYNTVGAPATAKNCIAVGATMNSNVSWSLFQDDDELYTTFGTTNNGKYFNEDSMAYFSSVGPTADKRIKPDVSVPGYYIISAKMNQTDGAVCDGDLNSCLAVMAGTSQATPTLAGSLAIARQYFLEGYYPTGEKNDDHAFSPSGALIKNVAINSASNMGGVKYSYGDSCTNNAAYSLTERPYLEQGFGRVGLADTLYLSGSTRYAHIPSLVDNSGTFYDDAISTDETKTYHYCVHPDTSQEVRITLVWSDYPSSESASVNLVNDLDLKVSYSSSITYGNSQ